MPTVAYMSVEGASQGTITQDGNTMDSMGNRYQEGHETEVTIMGFEHEILIPKDPQSGQPTGQRVHRPVAVRKIFDKSSPLLYNALCSGERLTKVEIKWYRTSMEGRQEHYFTHVLTDAMLTNVRSEMKAVNIREFEDTGHEEVWEMTYRKIEWTHEVAGTSGSDDWRAPLV
jgi:type VI secretion system secreted protein Hcp